MYYCSSLTPNKRRQQKNSIEGNACHSHFLSCWSNSMWQSKFSSLILNFAWGEERKWLMDSPAHYEHNDCTAKQCIHYVTSILVGTCNWFSLNLLLIFARYSIELQLQTLMAHDTGHTQCSTHASKLTVICELQSWKYNTLSLQVFVAISYTMNTHEQNECHAPLLETLTINSLTRVQHCHNVL